MSPRAPHIVVIGGINLDLSVEVDHLPRPGETVRGRNLWQHPGGKGANQAVAAAKMGGRVSMVGCVGRGAFGETMLSALADGGVNTASVTVVDEAPTGVALIGVETSGQNSIIVAAGANLCVTPALVDAALRELSDVTLGVINFEIPMEAVVAAARGLKAMGSEVVLNLAPARPPAPGLLDLVDILVVNEVEADMVLGKHRSPREAVMAMADLGSFAVVLTIGSEGAWCIDAGRITHAPGYLVEVVDTTAAGDAFIGALVTAHLAGQTLPECCRLGNAAGALSVTRAGAQLSLATGAEVNEFMERASPAANA